MDYCYGRGSLAAALLALLCSLGISGQQITGSVSGIVQDISGAALNGASITMSNDASGDVRRGETNSAGFFDISGVMPGLYTVKIEAPGFNLYEIQHIVFTSGDRRTLNRVILDVAPTPEEVMVMSMVSPGAPLESGERAAMLTTEQLGSLSVVGRSATEYLKILPGIAPVNSTPENRPGFNGENIGIRGNGDGRAQSMAGNVSVNGIRADALEITADGAHVSDPGCNCATPVNPNPEMISEFKVLQSNFSAMYAKGPVVINSVTRSGGNAFHGAGYLYGRHHSLNSNDALFNANGLPKPENEYLFPGGNIGGPVPLPGTGAGSGKMFFFTGYEYFKQKIDTGLLRSVVPAAAHRAGDFSDTEYLSKLLSNTNAGIGGAFPGGIIPAGDIDPGMQAMLGNIPLDNRDPAAAGGYNWVDSLVVDQNMHQFTSRADYSFNDSTKLFARYNLQRETQRFPVQLRGRNPGAVPLPAPIVGRNASDSLSFNFTKVITPAITNETVFGYTYVNFPNQYEDAGLMTKSTQGYPYQGIAGFRDDPKIPGLFAAAPAPSLSLPGGMDPVLFATRHLVTLSNNTTKVTGTHAIRFGGYWGAIISQQRGDDPSAGLMQFDPSHDLSTGNMLADMVTGRISQWDQASLAINRNMGWHEFAGFVQDTWKVKRNVSLELGARFQHLQPWTARNNQGIATWVETHYETNADAPASGLPGVQWNAINPAVPRSGRARKSLRVAPRIGFAWDVYNTGNTVLRGGFGLYHYHDHQLAAGAMDLPAGLRKVSVGGGMFLRDVDSIANEGSPTFDGEMVDSLDDRMPSTQSWNLTIAQRLSRTMIWTVSYAGNRSRGLTYRGGLRDINQVPAGAMIDDPYGDANRYRPRPQYNALTIGRHQAYANYNSMQTTVTQQTGRVQLTIAWTWSKAMGIVDHPLNSLDPDANYGPLGLDRSHVFAASYVVDMPDFAGAAANPFLKGIANQWQISGIFLHNSGAYLQQAAGSAGRNFNMNAEVNGQLLNPASVTGTPAINHQPILLCDPREDLGEHQYINGACFGAPIPGGNSRPGINGSMIFPYLAGPGFFNWDLALYKNFKIGESKNLQFRASFFNWMNHPNRSFVDGDPNLRLDLANNTGTTELLNDRFGYADSTVGKRIISFGIKFQF